MTKKLLFIGLAAALLVLFLSSISRADTPPPETVSVTPLPATFTIEALSSRSAAHCWVATLDNPIKNTFGKVQVWPALDTYWCSGRYERKVTDLVNLVCYNKGGFYSYDGCKRSHGELGFSYLSVHADWHYHWIINGLTFTKTPALNVQFYADGHATGTWYWFTG
jgi:hypothetical protein